MKYLALSRRLAGALLLLVLPLMAGCATLQQQQGQYIRATLQQGVADSKACVSAVYAKYPSLYMLDLTTGEPSMAQLTDETRPTPEQARLESARYDDLRPCRERFRSTFATVRPDLVPILDDQWAADEQLVALVVERKITWAEDARRIQQLQAAMRSQIAAANRELRAEINAENQTRAARAAAVASILAVMPRYHSTTCYGGYGYANCSGY